MWGDIAIAFMIAFVISFMATPHTIKIAKKIGAVDTPKDERRINKVPMPRLGGLAVIAGFFVSVVYLLIVMQIEDKIHFYADDLVYKLAGFFVGGLLICSVCFIDDCRGVPALIKLVTQILAAAIVVRSGLIIDTINLPFLTIEDGSDVFYIVLTIGWIVGITNALNLIDGLDGLSSGISLIACVSLLIIFSLNESPLISIVLITALAGALLGFLPYNFNPAKTFIGDTGSNFLGYCLSIISILGIAKTYTAIVIIAPILVLALPIFDTLSSIVRRLIHGKSLKSIIQPDAGHLHHRLLKKGFTQKQAVLIMYFVTATFGIFSIILMESGFWKAISFLGIIIIAVLLGYKEFFKQRLLSNPEDIKEDEVLDGQEEIQYITREEKVVNLDNYKNSK